MINNYDIAVLSEKVAYLEAAIKNAGIELPEVTTDDNGKTLQVVNGAWATGSKIPGVVNSLDSTSETDALSAAQGKALDDKITGIGGTVYSKSITATTDANGIITSDLSTSDYVYIGTDLTASLITLAVNALSDQKIRIKILNSTDLLPVTNTQVSDNFYFLKLN